MGTVIDRRNQPKGKGLTNRQRVFRRYKGAIKRALDKKISDGNVTDIIDSKGLDVTPKEGISEPFIHHGKGGSSDRVLPGNDQYEAGDQIPKPPGGGGGRGKQGSPDGDGEDDFTFHMTEKEALEHLYEHCELPELVKQGITSSKKTRPQRRGFASQGAFNRLDLPRSKRRKMGRKLAAENPYNKQLLELLQEQKDILLKYAELPESDEIEPDYMTKKYRVKKLKREVNELRILSNGDVNEQDLARLEELDEEIAKLDKKLSLIPTWVETTDLQFRDFEQKPVPIEKAVMFCLMDVSASMGQEDKDKAKLFFFFLYKFLQTQYEDTDVVFIRHTHEAAEVDEQEFFYGKKTGGTLVSSALDMMLKVIEERYPEDQWNIYGAQASDGENVPDDNAVCIAHMKDILDKAQAYFYTEIVDPRYAQYSSDDALWQAYDSVKGGAKNLYMGKISSKNEAWTLFYEFFKKREKGATPSAMQNSSPGLKMG